MLTSETITAIMPAFIKAQGSLFGHHEYPNYLVSDAGCVFSIKAGRYLKPIRMGKYLGVTIANRSGALVKRYVHRLILEIVTGECPPGMHACHNNGDRADNRIWNLRWATPTENNSDKVNHGTVLNGEKNPMARLTKEQVAEIRSCVSAGAVQQRVAEDYGVSPMTVSRIVREESWRTQ